MTYALLIYRATPASEPFPDAADRAGLTAHRGLQQEAVARGELHSVARLDEPDRARSIRWREGGHDVTDGPYIETKEWLIGLYVVDCATEEEAIARGRVLCTDRYHAVEVRPVTWRWKG